MGLSSKQRRCGAENASEENDEELEKFNREDGYSEEEAEGDFDMEKEEGEEEEEDDNVDDDESRQNGGGHSYEMEELEKEYRDLHQEELNSLQNLRSYKNEDLLKGQAVKNQKVLWDKALELRFLLQKAFTGSNRLPKEPAKSSFHGAGVDVAYEDLITSSKKTLDSLLELQEILMAKNPHIIQVANVSGKGNLAERLEDFTGRATDEEWVRVSQSQLSIASFRDKSVDKWQRKTQLTTGTAVISGKLHAFNQNISEQVTAYMRDPSRMIKNMQQTNSAVSVFGAVSATNVDHKEHLDGVDGDPELLDDAEFYQQLLKEFFETVNPTSLETAFYALKRLQTRKRKAVDRRASKSRKIRYDIHEKIVNFMVPKPVNIPEKAQGLFENLFGLKTQKLASVQ